MPLPDHTTTSIAHPARQAALEWLLNRINYERTSWIPYQERQLKLDRMRQLLTRLGQPEASLKIIHVAGTKGKGSTSAMISAMLTAAGYRTGFFSSPHLEQIEERFAVDGQPCSADEFVTLVDRVRSEVLAMDTEAAAEGDPAGGPTYFEITTAIALLHFVERQADAAVLEVGLGGRLDSTNVCLPVVSVITSISFDHMRQLGNTLSAIAREKAGIIKPGVPVISGVTADEPRAVVATIAREHGCRILQLGRDFQFHYHGARSFANGAAENAAAESASFDFRNNLAGQELALDHLELAMRGPHQAANAAVALAAVSELRHQGWCISTEAMRQGLALAKMPGRVEIIPGNPTIVLDTAHNPASARALIESLAELPPASRRTLIVSISHDKDVPAVVRELAHPFERIIVTKYQENPRAVSAEKLLELFRAAFASASERSPSAEDVSRATQPHPLPARAPELILCPTPVEALQHAMQTSREGELVCITGSFFLAAELRPLVLSVTAW
ncbi:MAG: bifunctional folylpolyglutamate synthase/dihydrofolate synthase [Pirellulales bacterium]|nr:bifunctional folylpolyglutamate synthase/dihydrofolate synthase [Pirellulales bacterium]